MIGAGQRDTLIAFERAAITRNSHNEEVESWGQLTRAFASVRYGTSAERREAAMTQARQSATFRVLATTTLRSVTGKDRISLRGQVWNVTGPAAAIGRSELEFTAIRAD